MMRKSMPKRKCLDLDRGAMPFSVLKKVFLGAVAGAVLLYLASIIAIARCAQRATIEAMTAQLATLGGPRTTLVLGMGPGADQPILDRAEAAVTLWRQGYVKAFITSGGQGADEPESEAATLRAALIAAGVPSAAIALESASRSTRENLLFSRRLLEATGRGSEPLFIVSHAFHARRIGLLASQLHLDAVVIGADGKRLGSPWFWLAREGLAYIKDYIVGL